MYADTRAVHSWMQKHTEHGITKRFLCPVLNEKQVLHCFGPDEDPGEDLGVNPWGRSRRDDLGKDLGEHPIVGAGPGLIQSRIQGKSGAKRWQIQWWTQEQTLESGSGPGLLHR